MSTGTYPDVYGVRGQRDYDAPSGDSLVAERVETRNWWSGSGLGEDVDQLAGAIRDGSWASGTMAGVATAADVASLAFNPVATVVSFAAGWIIEHIPPLPEMLDNATGDAGAVAAGSATWSNIAQRLNEEAQALAESVSADMAEEKGLAADAWRAKADELSGSLAGLASLADAIATGLGIAATLVQVVHDLIRDAISDAIGIFTQSVLEEVFTLGLATPAVAAQISTWVADKVPPLARRIDDLIESFRALSRLLDRIKPLIDRIKLRFARSRAGRIGKAVTAPKRHLDDYAERIGRKTGLKMRERGATSVDDLFKVRQARIAERNAAQDHLDSILPPGYKRSNFNAGKKRRQANGKMRKQGYSYAERRRLQKAARNLSGTRRKLNNTSARIGEVGAQRYLDENGYQMPYWSRTDVRGSQPSSMVDGGPALSRDGSELAVVECKGVSARLSRSPVHTQFEGQALQASPAWTRDHMLTDPRFAQYFRDNPDVWESVKNGDTALTTKVIYTRSPTRTVVEDIPFELTPRIESELQKAIDALP